MSCAQYYEDLLQDMKNTWHFILIGLFESVLLSVVYIYVFRWISRPMVWINLAGVFTTLSYGISVCYERWQIQDSCSISRFLSPRVTGVCDSSLESYFLMQEIWITLLIVCCLFIVVVSLIMIALRSKIRVAIDLIRETSKTMSKITSIHFFPIIPWLLHLAVVTFSIFVWLNLLSSRISEHRITGYTDACNCFSYTNNATCEVETFDSECRLSSEFARGCKDVKCSFYTFWRLPGIDWLHAYNIIAAIWSSFIIFAFQDMVLAGSLAKWYWKKQKNDLSRFTLSVTMLQTVRYHVGTLALGTVLNSVCGLLRLILDFVYRQLRKCSDHVILWQVKYCCNCLYWAVGVFLFFLNHNAYILCAIHGCNLQNSAKEALTLLRRNYHKVVVFDKIPYFLLFLAKLLLTLIAMVQWSLIFSYFKLKYHMFPVFTVGVGTYFVASLFFRVYTSAIDTLFILYLEDCERNDGSEEKPYCMSPEMRKTFQKVKTSRR